MLFFKLGKPGVTKSVKQMLQVKRILDKCLRRYAAEDILCAFDIDLTLIQPENPALYVPNVKKYIDVYQDIKKQYPNLDTTLPLVFSLFEPQHLVDEAIYDILKQLHGVKTIAFTASPSGPYLQAPRVEIVRYESLKQFQISFEGQFQDEDFVLDECPSYRSSKPCFYKGVLCSNSEKGTTTKGTVLTAFLRKIGWTPKCVILVDDRAKNLSDVSISLKEDFPKTRFVGIEYLKAHDYCPQSISKEGFKLYWEKCFVDASKL